MSFQAPHERAAWRRYKSALEKAQATGATPMGRDAATHTFPRSFVRHSLASGVPIDRLSVRPGHANPSTGFPISNG